VLEFTKNLKIYLFKEKDKVSFSVKVSNSYVNEYSFSIAEFEEFISQWNMPGGIDKHYSNGHWSVMHKKSTPRPESASASYVRLTVYKNGIGNHHRVDYSDMLEIQKDYFYQKNNKMYWDN
jgi:hypothetical protein